MPENSPRVSVYVLSYQRPELLACTLASICGFNAGYTIHIIDDGSSDPRVHNIIGAYQRNGLIADVEIVPHGSPCPPGLIRRRMIDRFIASGDEQLVQVESDMLVGPGQIKALVDAYTAIKAMQPNHELHVLNSVHWIWVRPTLGIIQFGPYKVDVTRGMSEPLWTSDRASLKHAVDAGLLPETRPDMVLWTDTMNGVTLLEPELHVQHIGAGTASLLYNYFAWDHVTIRSGGHDDGPFRQPYPEHPITWPDFETRMPQSAVELYEYLRSKSQVKLPEVIL